MKVPTEDLTLIYAIDTDTLHDKMTYMYCGDLNYKHDVRPGKVFLKRYKEQDYKEEIESQIRSGDGVDMALVVYDMMYKQMLLKGDYIIHRSRKD